MSATEDWQTLLIDHLNPIYNHFSLAIFPLTTITQFCSMTYKRKCSGRGFCKILGFIIIIIKTDIPFFYHSLSPCGNGGWWCSCHLIIMRWQARKKANKNCKTGQSWHCLVGGILLPGYVNIGDKALFIKATIDSFYVSWSPCVLNWYKPQTTIWAYEKQTKHSKHWGI